MEQHSENLVRSLVVVRIGHVRSFEKQIHADKISAQEFEHLVGVEYRTGVLAAFSIHGIDRIDKTEISDREVFPHRLNVCKKQQPRPSLAKAADICTNLRDSIELILDAVITVNDEYKAVVPFSKFAAFQVGPWANRLIKSSVVEGIDLFTRYGVDCNFVHVRIFVKEKCYVRVDLRVRTRSGSTIPCFKSWVQGFARWPIRS